MSLLAQVFKDSSLWPSLLLNELDGDLLPGFKHTSLSRGLSAEDADIEAKQAMENLKAHVRACLQELIDNIALGAETMRKPARQPTGPDKALHQKILKMNAPAPEGTVREIAERTGLSLKQVRKLKAEGRLSELAAF